VSTTAKSANRDTKPEDDHQDNYRKKRAKEKKHPAATTAI
jgi:hypothetical protein